MSRTLSFFAEYWVRRWQRSCVHPPDLVVADILDNDARYDFPGGSDVHVQHCRRCGAVRRASNYFDGKLHEGEWHVPDARVASWLHKGSA